MLGLQLLVGHLLGDYVFQNDWQAANKTAWGKSQQDALAGWDDVSYVTIDGAQYPKGTSAYHNARCEDVLDELAKTRKGHLACFVHCCLYTFAVALTTLFALPWWAYVIVWLAHFPVDRWRLARKMMSLTGQEAFATGPLSPWSIIVVDNTIHLVVLMIVGMATAT